MKKYFIYSFGCKVNRYETQLISEKLDGDGYSLASKPDEADLIVFNSCTVTANADKECEYFIRKTLKLSHSPKIIITGCLAKNKSEYLQTTFPSTQVLTDKTQLFIQAQNQTIKTLDNRSRAFVKIQDGCNSFCSYCIVPYVRNVLWSKPEEVVLDEITNLVKTGYSEIVLTGIHVGKYEGGISNLLEKIIAIPLDFRVRISSIELNELDEKLITLMKNNPDKICHHLHIPLQSGSDEVLKLMNRKYLTKDFETKINEIISQLPDISITTDIITGFPMETPKNHKESCEFVKNNPFSRFHIFRYSDREGTKASKFENKVSPEEIKSRSKDLFDIDESKRKEYLSKNINKTRNAVSTGKDKALTDNYITVKDIKKQSGIFKVKIKEDSEV